MTSESAAPEAPYPSERGSHERARSAARARLLGALLVFLSSIAFSTKAILVKLAYRQGIDSVSLLALRFGFAAPFFASAAFAHRLRGKAQNKLTRRDASTIVALGVLGYYLASLSDFIGLRYISAGLERLILFVYPTLVVLMSALWFKVAITRRTLLALGLTYGGVLLAVKTETAGARGPEM